MYGTKFAAAILLGMPACALGLILCATVIGIPLGVPLLMLSAMPLYKVIVKHNREVHDQPLDQGPKPWA